MGAVRGRWVWVEGGTPPSQSSPIKGEEVREGRGPRSAPPPWVPAFAGMTKCGGGNGEWGVGMLSGGGKGDEVAGDGFPPAENFA